ncbi:hypothetical protein L6R50_24570 [Myxococcota bacterium]|nr:hypothetical protein [Myxococcota bacterium]
MSAEPDPAFWNDKLRVPRFDDIVDPKMPLDRLFEGAREGYRGRQAGALFDAAIERAGRTGEVLRNLWLVASFAGSRRSPAVRDVADHHLDDVSFGHGRRVLVPRVPLGLRLFMRSPGCLVEMALWDEWHARRRAVHEVEGQRRRARTPFDQADWEALANNALGATARGKSPPPVFGGIAPRRDWAEVIVGFRSAKGWGGARRKDGSWVGGPGDDWALLLFAEDGNRVEVTSAHEDYARELAAHMGSALLGAPVRYRLCGETISRERLDDFVSRLVSGSEPGVALLEVVAELAEVRGRPMLALTNSGQNRIEHAVSHVRRGVRFAESSRVVRSIKVGFEQYRLKVHIPSGEDLRVTYSDSERDKDATGRFAEWVKKRFGFAVYPKARGQRSHIARTGTRGRPDKLTRKDWVRLLGPVLDDPEQWEEDELVRLSQAGVLTLGRSRFFRCGDIAIHAHQAPGDTLDCDGDIEYAVGDDPDDPHWREDDGERECSLCQRKWRPTRLRIESTYRLRIEVDPEGAWQWLREQLASVGTAVEEQPGVLRVDHGTGFAYFVFALPALGSEWLDTALALHPLIRPCCWMFPPGDERAEGFAGPTVELIDVLLHGAETVVKAWSRVRPAAGRSSRPVLAGDGGDRRAPVTTPKGPLAAPRDGAPVRVVHCAEGILIQGHKVFGMSATGVARLFKVLLRARARARRSGKERRYWNATELARMVKEAGIDRTDVNNWLHSYRKGMERAYSADPGFAERVIERDPEGGGVRLGDAVEANGFDSVEWAG